MAELDYAVLGEQLDLLAVHINDLAAQNGQTWSRNNPEGTLMRIVAELAEAYECVKSHAPLDEIEWGNDIYSDTKPEGFRIELIDAVIGLAHLIELHGGAAEPLTLKMAYREQHGWGRPH